MGETAADRLVVWYRHGASTLGGKCFVGVACDILAIEARLAALESSRPVQPASETAAAVAGDPGREGGHIADAGEMVGSTTEASDGPGRGYRWLEVGEELERGDELWWTHAWQVTARSPGAICRDEKRYRRRITPADAVPDDAGRRLVNGEPMTAAELMHALTVARQEIARLTAERDAARAEVERTIAARNAAIGERDEFRKSWLSATDHATRLVSQRDAALAEVERHRMTMEERESAVNGLHYFAVGSSLVGVEWQKHALRLGRYLERTKEGE